MARGDVLGAGRIQLGKHFDQQESESYLVDPNLTPVPGEPVKLNFPPTPILTPEQREFYESDVSPFHPSRILPIDGEISFFQIRDEVGGAEQCSFNDEAFRNLIGKSDGEEQAISDYYGKSFDLGFGENAQAVGGHGSLETSGTSGAGTTGNANRYVRARVGNNNTTGDRKEVRYWIFVPLAQAVPDDTTIVKLDYQFTHDGSSVYNSAGIGVGTGRTPPSEGFKPPEYQPSGHMIQNPFYLVYSDPSASYSAQHVDGSGIGIPSYSGQKQFNASTFFEWKRSKDQHICFEATTNGYNGGGESSATINYKLTEM